MTVLPKRHHQIDRKPFWQTKDFLLICFLGIITLHSTSCRQDFSPKPTAYPRISYPQSNFTGTGILPCPVSFEYPVLAKLEIPRTGKATGNWINLKFDTYNATLHTSYYQVGKNNVQKHLIENETILEKEVPPFAHIHKKEFSSRDGTVEGYLYEINGNSACPVQFILTDKKKQIFRGALYFNYLPNRDSIKDILDGLTNDIRHLMESFQFKK